MVKSHIVKRLDCAVFLSSSLFSSSIIKIFEEIPCLDKNIGTVVASLIWETEKLLPFCKKSTDLPNILI